MNGNAASLGRNGMMRAPPVRDERRQGELMFELNDLFDHLNALAKEIQRLERRRAGIEARLTDASLLETHPPGSPERETARNELAYCVNQHEEFRRRVHDHGGTVALKLKQLNRANYDHMLAFIGGGWKDEPIWAVVQSIPVFERSGEWQDLGAAMLRADGSRVPPF